LLYHAFGVREGYEYWRTEYADGCVRFFLLVKPKAPRNNNMIK
jgi:hypothetical protein